MKHPRNDRPWLTWLVALGLVLSIGAMAASEADDAPPQLASLH